MKTLQTLLALGLLYAGQSQAQVYGEMYYPHQGSYLSSAQSISTSNGAEFVIAGYIPFSTAANPLPDFVIDKVDNQLGFNNAATDFSMEYYINEPISCGAPTRVFNCSGVSVIETTNQGAGERYVVAGAYNYGFFVASLDATGGVINSYRWDFPPGTPFSYPQPALRESSGGGGTYYVCGEYNNQTYVAEFTIAGGITSNWSNLYDNGYRLTGMDVIHSPYNANEVIVVGRVDIQTSLTAADGLFMSLNTANMGSVNFALNYNKQFDGDEWIACIDYANNPSNQGYVIGGHSRYPFQSTGGSGNTEFSQWMARLQPNGNTNWTTLIYPNGSSAGSLSGREISDVFERYNTNTTPPTYEYYGAAASNFTATNGGADNIVVYKLDDNGSVTLSPDEFHYQNAIGPVSSAPYTKVQLTQFSNAAWANTEGLQVYGTSTANDLYLSKGYFNGATGCDLSYDIFRDYPGPTVVGNINVNVNQLIPNCPNAFLLTTTVLTTPTTAVCQLTTNVSYGSNLRPVATGINKYNASTSTIQLLPNPVNGKATIRYSANEGDVVNITICNALGQQINVDLVSGIAGETEFDLSRSDLPSGIYFADVKINETLSRIKFVYTRN